MKKNQLEILLENDHVVVANKPAGLLSVPDRYDADILNLKHLLVDKREMILPVHRLDRGTSGVICFAKNVETQRFLTKQFEERSIEKTYHAIVAGRSPLPEGEIDAAIAYHPHQLGKMHVASVGKAAVTNYKMLEFFRSHSYMELKPQTGRTHQLRVHLAYLGCPILSDGMYSLNENFFLSEIKGKKFRTGKNKVERPLLSRPALHAFSLSFYLPESSSLTTVKAPLPKDMRATLNQLRKLG